MSKLKAMAAVLAVIAFFAYCMWISPFLFGNRIRSEMKQDSILKYDAGANIYIASKDDNSKVYFGQSGSYKFYGTGALTYMASPKSEQSAFRSGFNLLIEGGSLELKTGQADILTGSVSPNGQFLALLSIDGILTIHEISTGRVTYKTKHTLGLSNPLNTVLQSYPFFYWTDQGLITKRPIGDETAWKKKRYYPKDIMNITNNEHDLMWDSTAPPPILSIDPSTGNVNEIIIYKKNTQICNVIGQIDSTNIFVQAASSEYSEPGPFIFSLNTQTSEMTKLYYPFPVHYKNDVFSNLSGNKIYHIIDKTLVYSIASAKSMSDPIAVKLPELDGEKLTPDKIESLRVTSKGYLCFRHIKTAKTYLLDPDTGVYVEIPKERYPY